MQAGRDLVGRLQTSSTGETITVGDLILPATLTPHWTGGYAALANFATMSPVNLHITSWNDATHFVADEGTLSLIASQPMERWERPDGRLLDVRVLPQIDSAGKLCAMEPVLPCARREVRHRDSGRIILHRTPAAFGDAGAGASRDHDEAVAGIQRARLAPECSKASSARPGLRLIRTTSDAGQGEIKLTLDAPAGPAALIVPVMTGPAPTGMRITISDSTTSARLAALADLPAQTGWRHWTVTLPGSFPGGPGEAHIEDRSGSWGAWLAIAPVYARSAS